MTNKNFDNFLILLRVKSYLISMLDEPDSSAISLELTEEYLGKKYPEKKEEILHMLNSHQIVSDSQIAFDENIHLKFRKIIIDEHKNEDIQAILEKYNINALNTTPKERTIENYRADREKRLKEIITVLLQIAKSWTERGQLEDDFEDYSLLSEEEMIRPTEEQKLGSLNEDTSKSYQRISDFTQLYLELLIDYFFHFGGDLTLIQFLQSLEESKKSASKKYYELIKKSGIDPNTLSR